MLNIFLLVNPVHKFIKANMLFNIFSVVIYVHKFIKTNMLFNIFSVVNPVSQITFKKKKKNQVKQVFFLFLEKSIQVFTKNKNQEIRCRTFFPFVFFVYNTPQQHNSDEKQ